MKWCRIQTRKQWDRLHITITLNKNYLQVTGKQTAKCALNFNVGKMLKTRKTNMTYKKDVLH